MTRGDPLVIVAPTPVFGMMYTEAWDKRDFLKNGSEGPDFEHWRFNQLAHHEFIRGLIQKFDPRFGVFLSGDVHTSFTAIANYQLRPGSIHADEPIGPEADIGGIRFYQYRSSPLKNENDTIGGQIFTTKWMASEILDFFLAIEMQETWDLVGYDRSWRQRVISKLLEGGEVGKSPQEIQKALYIYAMDGQSPDDPFVTATSLVARKLQNLRMGAAMWRETGRYFRHWKKDSDDSTYPYNNIGYVSITATEVHHDLCAVASPARLMPRIKRYPFVDKVGP
jgi:hypothetical protein